VPEGWRTYSGVGELLLDQSWVLEYDKGLEHRELPEGVDDRFAQVMKQNGYFIHDYHINKKGADVAPIPEVANLDALSFDLYLVGHSTPAHEGASLTPLFNDLSGIDEFGRRVPARSILGPYGVEEVLL